MQWLALLFLPCAHALILSDGAAHTLKAGLVHRELIFAPPRLVEDLRLDVDALAARDLFTPAGSGPRGSGESNGMRSATFADPISRDRAVGCWDAFVALWMRLDMVRCELAEGLGRDLVEETEIHYVRYPVDGFFQRHVDDFEETEGERPPSRRSVSFICYLNEPGWSAADGGALRVYAPGAAPHDLLPESGSLVLFDSSASPASVSRIASRPRPRARGPTLASTLRARVGAPSSTRSSRRTASGPAS